MYYTYVRTYLCTYVFDLLLVKYKWCVVLSIVMEHQFHCLCCLSRLQEGLTAIMTATINGHLTVLRTLVEQYGGNVLHRTKVKCYRITHHFLMWKVMMWDRWEEERYNLCCKYFIALQLFFAPILYILHLHPYCLFLCILHVRIHSACTCSSDVCVHGIFKYGGASLWQPPLGPSCLSCIERCP